MRIMIPSMPDDSIGVSLRVQLATMPSSGESSIDRLVTSGLIRLSMVVVPEQVNREVNRDVRVSNQAPIYAREARFTLSCNETVCVTAEARGEAPQVTLVGELDRFSTLEVIRALAGRQSQIKVGVSLRTRGGATEQTRLIQTTLSDLARSITIPTQLDRWVKLVAPDRHTGDLIPVPNRIPQVISRGFESAQSHVAPFEKGFANVATLATVSPLIEARPSTFAAHAAMLSARPNNIGQIIHFPPIIFLPPDTRPHLPRVDDESAMLWQDAVDPSQYWYIPIFSVLSPDPGQQVSTSPFTFRFKQSGHTASGEPGIDAHIQLTLKQAIDEATQQRLQQLGNPTAKPVDFKNLAVSLSIPFRDEQGVTRRENFMATLIVTSGTLVANVALIDNWAKLAYGALAVEGFQPEPARIRVDIAFQAMVQIPNNTLSLVLAAKHERLPPAEVIRINPTAPSVKFTRPTGLIQLTRETRGIQRDITVKPLDNAQIFAIHSQLHGEILASSEVNHPLYGQKTLGHAQEIACLFPCNSLGAFYLQSSAQDDIAIGCRDAMQLAQIEYRQYEQITDTRFPANVRVLRSLQQPGHFLLVPASYKITRFGKDAGERAYRSAAFLYSSVDADTPQNNRCVLLVTLGPDLAAHELERLREILREQSPAPSIQLITEIIAEVSYIWSLPNADIMHEHQAIRLWDSFQVSILTEITQVSLLQSMLATGAISITATFVLPDKTSWETTLKLDSTSIIGPFDGGPIAAACTGENVLLTNRIERDVDIDDILIINDAAKPGETSITPISVDRTLAVGESMEISASLPKTSRIVPVAIPKPASTATVTEIRSFVEDIYARIAFVNLINYANHDLVAIAIEAQIKGVQGTFPVTTTELQPIDTLDIVLPLTQYLANPVLQFRATITKLDQSSQQLLWIDWPLMNKGNVVSLTWELLNGGH